MTMTKAQHRLVAEIEGLLQGLPRKAQLEVLGVVTAGVLCPNGSADKEGFRAFVDRLYVDARQNQVATQPRK